MSLPEYIEELDAPLGSDEPHGIIYRIQQKVTADNLLKYVIPTTASYADTHNGNLNAPVLQNGHWQSNSKSAYYQIEFKESFVFLTNYSLKGLAGSSFARKWNLYGFNSENTEMELLSSDGSLGSSYCGGLISGNCANDNWGTFVVKN